MQATLVYWEDEGLMVGRIKEMPGVFSQGATLDELKENIRDAYQLMIEDDQPQLVFDYESTGEETFFCDQRDPKPRSRRLFAFHRPETLHAWLLQPETLRARLRSMPTQAPLNCKGLRDCQVEAITGKYHDSRVEIE